MRSFAHVIPIIALLVANAPLATAQTGDSSHAASCGRDSRTAGSYLRCALWTDGSELKRGVPDGIEISHIHRMTPLAMSRFVIGDSARRYALSYEWNARRGLEFRYVGKLLIVAGAMASIPRPCSTPTPVCMGSRHASIIGGLIGGGVVLELASLSFKFRAAQASTRALWWHNALLAR